jgi:hypothetical protein
MSADAPEPIVIEANPTYMQDGRLYTSELFWRDHQPWLKECGYLLRPRYHPDWVASWKGVHDNWDDCEDAQIAKVREISSFRLRRLLTVVLCSKAMSSTPHVLRMGHSSC